VESFAIGMRLILSLALLDDTCFSKDVTVSTPYIATVTVHSDSNVHIAC
jgi:hypothetical protein